MTCHNCGLTQHLAGMQLNGQGRCQSSTADTLITGTAEASDLPGHHQQEVLYFVDANGEYMYWVSEHAMEQHQYQKQYSIIDWLVGTRPQRI
eukprot:2740662-Pyramimonas_sp.AAC.1